MTGSAETSAKGGHDELAEDFAAIVGNQNVIREAKEREFYSRDVFQWEDAPLIEFAVRPADASQISAILKLAGRHGLAVAPRGGGLSYTQGYVPEKPGTILIDLGHLNEIEEINEADLYVTVGCAVSWQQIMDALRPRGLRTVMVGPISGAFSTVGGAASQNVPGSMESIVGLEVVLSDGRIVRTGSSAIRRTQSPFYRHFGPDLTGLFLGDTGALGVKTRLTLRIERIPAGVAFASYAFENLATMAAAMADVARTGLAAKSLGMDPLKTRTATNVDLGEIAPTVRDVVRSRGSIVRGLKDAAGMVAAGRGTYEDAQWSLHLTAEGFDQETADRTTGVLSAICTGYGGRPLEPSLPVALRARPFSIRGFLGLQGERWVPVHGIFPLSRTQEVVEHVQAFFAEHAGLMSESDVAHSYLTAINGPFWLLEPMFYWFDDVGDFYSRYLDEAKYSRFAQIEANPHARAVVTQLRGELRDLFFDLGAVSAQIGKYYDFRGALEPETYDLLTTIKGQLDPGGILNPGNFGWR